MYTFNHFPEIAAAFPGALEKIVSSSADELTVSIQAFIRSNGQIKTGYMHDSVHMEDGPDELTKFVICGAPYGIYQNYGTRYMPGRPFWEPGIDIERPRFESRLEALENRLPH